MTIENLHAILSILIIFYNYGLRNKRYLDKQNYKLNVHIVVFFTDCTQST
jgi:hypothetical protein